MKRLVLVGAGHAHVQVLRAWADAPLPGVELVLVSPQALAPYSGMVPGWLAGAWGFDDICINAAGLAAAAGARWLADAVVGLDATTRQLRLGQGALLAYDVLSLDIGSTLYPPEPTALPPGARLLAMRPLDGLQARWDALLAEQRDANPETAWHVTAVGGGAAGVESLLGILARLRALQPRRPVAGMLVSRSIPLLPGMASGAASAAHAALAAAGVTLHLGVDFDPTLHCAAANTYPVVLWAAGAQAQHWPQRSGLATDAQGFIAVDAQLRSLSHPEVHAAGDCAAWVQPLPKSGVYAVRMGPVLTRNLRAALGQGSAATYTPQRRTLALLSTADGRAIASWGPLSAQGRWVQRWKQRTDRAFLQRHAVPAAALSSTSPAAINPVQGDSA